MGTGSSQLGYVWKSRETWEDSGVWGQVQALNRGGLQMLDVGEFFGSRARTPERAPGDTD